MIQAYLAPFIIAVLISTGLTYYVRMVAVRFNLVDRPAPRKIHSTPIPRLGGVAIVLALLIVLAGYAFATHRLTFSPFKFWIFDKRLIGATLGLLILLIVGFVDDVKGITAWKKLFWHLVAATVVVIGGLSISYMRLPFGAHVDLTTWQIPVQLFSQTYHFVVWGDLLTIFWIVLLINTLNFLDGLDGLAAGVSVITGLVIFFLSLSLGQDANALLAILIAGVALGFLPWNFNPARIFMGDSGSMALGYLLGISSIISGGKLTTAFLVLGIPVLDVGWVVLRRLLSGRSPFEADKGHLHHRLLTAGLTQRQAVVLLYLMASAFGIIAVVTSTQAKIQAVLSLVILMFVLALVLVFLEYRKKRRESDKKLV